MLEVVKVVQSQGVSQHEFTPHKAMRNQAIEVLRILSAYAIIAYHAGAPGHGLVYAGLVVFLVLGPFAELRFAGHRTRSVTQLARVLLIPWVFWCLAYSLLNVTMHQRLLGPADTIVGILYGTSPHLWFLPYLFITSVLLNEVKCRVNPSPLFWTAALTSAALLASVSVWREPSMTWPLPLPQWMHALPAVCLGIVLGLSHKIGRTALVSYILIGAALLLALLADAPGVGLPYAVGFVLTASVLLPPVLKLSNGLNVQAVSSCMYGVFLTHILWLQLAIRVAGRGNYLTVSLAFGMALVTVAVARRFWPMSRLILG